MVKVFWPELFEVVGDDDAARRARAVGARTPRSSPRFLAARADDLPPLVAPSADSRRVPPLVPPAPRAARRRRARAISSRSIDGCEVVTWDGADRCCGFGGLFSVKLPETSVAMADEKLAALAEAKPDVVVSADSSCLLHLRSRAEAVGRAIDTRHIAEVLAAALPASRPQRATVTDRLTGTTLRQRTAVAVADPVLRRNVARAVDRFAGHRVRGLAELDDADGLRAAARAIRLRTLEHLPDLLEQLADALLANGGHVCWARTPAEANGYITALARNAARARS